MLTKYYINVKSYLENREFQAFLFFCKIGLNRDFSPIRKS